MRLVSPFPEMNAEHLAALAVCLSFYALLAISCYGWGAAVMRVLPRDSLRGADACQVVWLGWAMMLLCLQLLHLFVAVDWKVSCLVFGGGLLAAIPRLAGSLRARHPLHAWHFAIGALFLVFSVWLGSRAMASPENYDSGLYHLNKIRWINSYPVVPGLGNLHGRLAFNQSFFTYVAALNLHPWFGHGRSIANSFLVLLAAATFMVMMRPLFARFSTAVRAHPFMHLPALILTPALIYGALRSPDLSSPSPDLTSLVLQLVIFALLLQLIGGMKAGDDKAGFRIFLLGVLAATAVTIKLSNIVFCLTVWMLMAGTVWVLRSPRELLATTVASSAIILTWGVHGMILAGVPLYPSTLGYVPFDWAVPREMIHEEALVVYAWARLPGDDWRAVLENWDWFGPWLKEFLRHKTSTLFPLLISAPFAAIVLIMMVADLRRRRWRVEYLVILPPCIALTYWFFSAPSIRFAFGILMVLPASLILVALAYWQSTSARKAYLPLVFGCCLMGTGHYLQFFIRHQFEFANMSTSGWQPVSKAVLVERTTRSGLLVHTPASGDQCWDSPLPSTPYFNDSLTLRRKGDPASGFRIEKDGD
jgi:hypothetical protein